MDDSTAEETLSVAVPDIAVADAVAVIVIGPPVASAVTTPVEPALLLTVATAMFEDDQVTEDVRSCFVRSENVPVAINDCFTPGAILALSGVTAMDDSTAEVTVRVAVPAFPVAALVAVIVIGPPAANPFTSPLKPAVLLTVATAVFEDDQVTDDVRSCIVRSE